MYISFRFLSVLAIYFFCTCANSSEVYEKARIKANAQRFKLFTEFENAKDNTAQVEVITRASKNFHDILVEDLVPPWYGTQWDYNGTTTTPGVGTIACGYFVTTLLRDVGVKLERARLAQQASELIIKTLVGEDSIRRFSNSTMDNFVRNIEGWGAGLYIVGLDNHVGFLSIDDDGFYFIHSSVVMPSYVLKEEAQTSWILESSRYKVVGKLDDKRFIKKWLNGEVFSF